MRNATPAAYSDAQACSSFDAAYVAAQVGDLALVKPGAYGNQTIDGPSKAAGSCDGYTIGASLSGCVTLRAQTPGTVTLNELRPTANYLRVTDMHSGGVYLQPGGCAQ